MTTKTAILIGIGLTILFFISGWMYYGEEKRKCEIIAWEAAGENEKGFPFFYEECLRVTR